MTITFPVVHCIIPGIILLVNNGILVVMHVAGVGAVSVGLSRLRNLVEVYTSPSNQNDFRLHGTSRFDFFFSLSGTKLAQNFREK